MKQCFKCGEEKPLTEFYAHPQMADGHLNKCKDCAKKDVLKNRASRVEYYRAYDRDRFQNNPDRRAATLEANRRNYDPRKASAANRRHRGRYPERYTAKNAVNNAVRDGKLERQPFCEICGEPSQHAHHDDYSKPLDVRWLCGPCHRRVHREINEANRSKTNETIKC